MSKVINEKLLKKVTGGDQNAVVINKPCPDCGAFFVRWIKKSDGVYEMCVKCGRDVKIS